MKFFLQPPTVWVAPIAGRAGWWQWWSPGCPGPEPLDGRVVQAIAVQALTVWVRVSLGSIMCSACELAWLPPGLPAWATLSLVRGHGGRMREAWGGDLGGQADGWVAQGQLDRALPHVASRGAAVPCVPVPAATEG